MSYFRVNNWNPPEKKQKQLKQPKQSKPKKEKAPKQPKPEPEPPKVLTPAEYVESLIKEKEDAIDSKFGEIEVLQKVINALKARQLNDIILNERCILVNKVSNKLIKMKDKNKEEREKIYNDMMNDIKKFDEYFDIISDKLLGCLLKY